jgi:kinesin family protein 2/24
MPVLPKAGAAAGAASKGSGASKNTLQEIQRLQKERDERRKAMEVYRSERAAEQQRNAENGNFGDVDFQRLVRSFREDRSRESPALDHLPSRDMKICIAVRKRPINTKEVKKRDYDSVTCLNPTVIVHDCKYRVDGITKYLDSNSFEFDHTFHEDDSTDDVYLNCVENLLPFVLQGGRATVFAYGQTGSGKTHTMVGIQGLLAADLFQLLESDKTSNLQVVVSFFEIYGGRCQDLLNNRNRLNVREDGSGEVVVSDLAEVTVQSMQDMLDVIELGNQNRTTHATESNDVSSRSHAICQISLKLRDKVHGKLSLIDLAGSERGSDTQSNNRQRRLEVNALDIHSTCFVSHFLIQNT